MRIISVFFVILILCLSACDKEADKSFLDPVFTPDPNDQFPPTVEIDNISDSSSVAKGNISVSVTANDDTGIRFVELRVDNTLLTEDHDAPYVLIWDTSRLSSFTWHELCVKAYDNGGKSSYICIHVMIQ